MTRVLVVDLLARAKGERYATHDVVGAGPRLVTGLLESLRIKADLTTYEKLTKNLSIIDEYDIVMYSAMSSDYVALKNLAKSVWSRKTSVLQIVGGPIGFEFDKILRKITGIDIVVVGEGEYPLIELFSKHKEDILSRNYDLLDEVKGIAYKVKNRIIFTGFPPYTSYDILNKIMPFTKIDRVYEEPQVYRFYVEVLRGCSNFYRPLISIDDRRVCVKCMKCYSNELYERLTCPQGIYPGCGFCSVPFQFGPPRSRSITSIYTEIKELIRHGAERIVLSAPDFLDYGRDLVVKPLPLTNPCKPPYPNYKAIKNLLEKIHEIPEVYKGDVKIFIENIKACLVDEEISKILGTYLRGTTVHIGLETASKDYNRVVLGKPIDIDQVLKAVSLLRKHGLRPYVYLIYGLPFINENVYRETINSIEKLYNIGVEKITLYKFAPLPFTAFENLRPNLSHKELIRELKKTVDYYNLLAKEKYFLNRKVIAYIVFSRNRLYAYPVDHGPVIFLREKNKKLHGCKAEVLIISVKPRYVIGEIVRIIRCYA